MAKANESNREHEDESGDALFRIHQFHRTIRTLIITAGLVLGLWIISWAVVEVTKQEKPAWLTIVIAILAAVGLGTAPTIRWIAKIRIYMQRDHQRTIQLEAELDKNRESSGIKEDGTASHD